MASVVVVVVLGILVKLEGILIIGMECNCVICVEGLGDGWGVGGDGDFGFCVCVFFLFFLFWLPVQ